MSIGSSEAGRGKLTKRQIKALRMLRDHGQPTFGVRSMADERLRASLVERGLMIEAPHPLVLPKLTDAGREALSAVEGE